MATAHKFNKTGTAWITGEVNLTSDTLKVMLTNTAPPATAQVYSDISATELASGNGYTTGGGTIPGTSWSVVGDVGELLGSPFTWTAGPSSMGPFQYAVAYDSTPANKVLLGWWDYGAPITILTGLTFIWSPTGGIILTLV